MKIYLYHLIFTSKILKGDFQTGTTGCASFSPLVKNRIFVIILKMVKGN